MVMTWELWEILRHSIGMERRNYRRKLDWWLDNDNHRNHYAINPGCDGFDKVERLVINGFMFRGSESPGGMRYYHVSPLGIQSVRAEFFRVKGYWNKAGSEIPALSSHAG
jgi:hypothetical protein